MLAELYTDPSTSISMHAMKCIDEHQCGSVANCYTVLQEEVPSIVDCPDPDHMTPHERRVARIAHEEASFDAEYYLYVTPPPPLLILHRDKPLMWQGGSHVCHLLQLAGQT